jgi:acetate kinase
MSGAILTLNAGSSSLKFALFDDDTNRAETMRGEITNLDTAPEFSARNASGKIVAARRFAAGTHLEDLVGHLLKCAEHRLAGGRLVAVGHRVVHGGQNHSAPALVTPALLQDLDRLTPLEPLHMPLNLAPIRSIAALRSGMTQVACFDTAFHHTLPMVARNFALPRALTDEGVRRYGFHGLSYEYISGQLQTGFPALAAGRVIAAHLGAGASLCALAAGVSIATTTGFSALEGLIMATRCGRLDPGILLYLGAQGKSFLDIEDILYHRSGLAGVSGISGDVRVLLASTDAHARQALDLFTYNTACEIGGLAVALGGLDGLVFTAGIGAHAPAIRAAICARLTWLNALLDPAANAANAPLISLPASRVEIRVIATNEEAMIARHTQTLRGVDLRQSAAPISGA